MKEQKFEKVVNYSKKGDLMIMRIIGSLIMWWGGYLVKDWILGIIISFIGLLGIFFCILGNRRVYWRKVK